MKALFFVLLSVEFLLACGGSCIECHPKLQPLMNDKDHMVLNECVTCHDKPVEHGACGQDCFSCHDKGKLYGDASVKEHQAIKQCYSCHKENSVLPNLIKNDVSLPNRQKPLIEIFK